MVIQEMSCTWNSRQQLIRCHIKDDSIRQEELGVVDDIATWIESG